MKELSFFRCWSHFRCADRVRMTLGGATSRITVDFSVGPDGQFVLSERRTSGGMLVCSWENC